MAIWIPHVICTFLLHNVFTYIVLFFHYVMYSSMQRWASRVKSSHKSLDFDSTWSLLENNSTWLWLENFKAWLDLTWLEVFQKVISTWLEWKIDDLPISASMASYGLFRILPWRQVFFYSIVMSYIRSLRHVFSLCSPRFL